MKKFTKDFDGFTKAMAWLKQIGQYERVSNLLYTNDYETNRRKLVVEANKLRVL